MAYTINQRTVSLTRDEVISRLTGVRPELGQKHFVNVDGIDYPVKQALEVVTGIERNEFVATLARSIFRSLGFQLKER
jgi:hypothetical protein